MATAEHAAFVPRPRVTHVMVAATRANLDSAARHAARTGDTPDSQDWIATATNPSGTSTSTTTTTVPAPAPESEPATQNPVGPEIPPNPVTPTQIDAP